MQTSISDTLEAGLAIEFLNAQLSVNYEAARQRYELYQGADLSQERRNSYAWARFNARQKGRDAATLEFAFRKPRLSFVCDHDGLLTIEIDTATVVTNDMDGIPNSTQMHHWHNTTRTFRITTGRRTIVGNDVKVGDHESRIHMLVFDFEHARPVGPITHHLHVEQHAGDDVELERHLIGYLRALQVAGHHVLFLAPEFDEDDLRTPIRFSLTSEDPPELHDIAGFTTPMINRYLSLLWYTSAFAARQRMLTGRPEIWDHTTSLAGYHSWLFPGHQADWHSSYRVAQPRATILCGREVILYFTLSEIRFYRSSDYPDGIIVKSEVDYGDEEWVIALVVDVTTSSTEMSILADSARYVSRFSKYPDITEEHVAARDLLVTFFVEQYFKLVAGTRLQHLVRNVRDEQYVSRSTLDADGSWWMLERDSKFGSSALDNTIRHTKMHGFDVVIAISQTSINTQLRSRLSRIRELLRWERSDCCIEVKSVSVRLLYLDQSLGPSGIVSDAERSRAILTVHVSEGTLTSLVNNYLELIPQDQSYRFGECRLAFEVTLREYEHQDLHNPNYSPKPYSYPTFGHDDYLLHHIYLDLENAQHSPEHSTFDDSWDLDGFIDNRVQMTVVDRILKEYLPELMTHGAHVIASVPIYKSTATPAFYRLTSMAFRTYAETNISSGADAELSASRPEQILFILGMTADGVLPRAKTFKPSARWVVHARAGFSHGTFAICRNTFHLRLHSLLARINALTTLVPVSPSYDGMAGGRDIVQQWAKHKDFSSQSCDWKAVDSDDSLTADKFEWQYTREWNMSEEGTRLAVRGNYFVSCTTHNELELPDVTTLSSGSLAVRMSGTIKLRIASTRTDNTWSTESSAFWKVSINLKTAGRGIVKVEIDGMDNLKQLPPKTIIRRGSAEIPDAYQILQAHLPQKEDFANVLKELEELQGAWKYYYPGTNAFALCSPMFNFDGDLLFELRRSQTIVRGHSSTTSTTMNGSPISPHTRTGRSASPSPISPRNGAGQRPRVSSSVERRSAPTSRSSSPVLGQERGRTPPPVSTRFGGEIVATSSPTRSAGDISLRHGPAGSRIGTPNPMAHGRRESSEGVGVGVRINVPQNSGAHHSGRL
ncbi:hypothetical protein LXA43DRAFT_891537 [Ganoderma leucocontextum]|nr:hypothetical protein LXA43DRAFT_891537 [Ganoderma leucocontextum]